MRTGRRIIKRSGWSLWKELIINWYSPADDAVLPIRRYILEKDFERVKEILMNHYPDSVIYEGKSEYTMKEVEERPGYFVRKAV